jgi:hypothetical protein
MLLLVAMALSTVALGAAAWLAAARRPTAARALPPLLLALLATRAALSRFPAAEWALFPWPGYAYVQGFTLYPLAVAFLAAAAARLPVRWNRAVVLAVATGVLGHGLHRHAWLAWPEAHGDGRVADAQHHMRQSTVYTCGPAACASALSHCGIVATEAELARACLTRRAGTSLFDLYRGLVETTRDRAIAVSIEDPTADELLAAGHVVIASNDGGGHALCYVTTNGDVLVHDPMSKAPATWSRSQFRDSYRGPAIVLRPLPASAPR